MKNKLTRRSLTATNPHFAVKFILQLTIFACLSLASAQGTPDRATTIHEKFLGSNTTGYAILRTESDNLGSHYSEHCRTWLDEYEKNGLNGKLTRSSLLLDQSLSMDAENVNKQATVENSKDKKISLAYIIQKYPQMSLTSWTKEQIRELQLDQKNKKIKFKTQDLIKGEVLGSLPMGADSILAVEEDSNCIFVTLLKGLDESREVRIVCIPVDVTRNVHALMHLEPLYLCAGTFKSEKEALEKVREMQVVASKYYKGKYYNKRNLMIWSVYHSDIGKTDYVVVLANSSDIIGGNSRPNSTTHPFGSYVMPITSKGFRKLVFPYSN